MLAYSQVDPLVRRKLEEMLKTWREPVPGSLSSVPVFPLASTQSIVDALNRFRAVAASRGQPQYPGQQAQIPAVTQAQIPLRATATPPQQQFMQAIADQTPTQNSQSQFPTVSYGRQPVYSLFLTLISHLNKHRLLSSNSLLHRTLSRRPTSSSRRLSTLSSYFHQAVNTPCPTVST